MGHFVRSLAREIVVSLRRHRSHVAHSREHQLIAVPAGRFLRGIASHVVDSAGDQLLRSGVVSPIGNHGVRIWIVGGLLFGVSNLEPLRVENPFSGDGGVGGVLRPHFRGQRSAAALPVTDESLQRFQLIGCRLREC